MHFLWTSSKRIEAQVIFIDQQDHCFKWNIHSPTGMVSLANDEVSLEFHCFSSAMFPKRPCLT